MSATGTAAIFQRWIPTSIYIAFCLAPGGCSVGDLNTAERRERGLVIVLPGIEGPSNWNANLARGLAEGGVRSAIEIHDWGTPIPGGMLINLADYERNQASAERLKDHILEYMSAHPRRSVHLVGHSGGGGLAVLAVEKLPTNKPVSSIVLLAAALSPDYDLRESLGRTRFGIFNYYSKLDAGLLGVGTSLAGTIDRQHVIAAGAVGFNRPSTVDDASGRLYSKLHQIEWRPEMRAYGHLGGHMGWTERSFVRRYLGPLISDLNSSPPPISGWETE